MSKKKRIETNRKKKLNEIENHREIENWRESFSRTWINANVSNLIDFETNEIVAWKYNVMRFCIKSHLFAKLHLSKSREKIERIWYRCKSNEFDFSTNIRNRSFTINQNFDDVKFRNEINEQAKFAFFNDLYIDLNVAIEKREIFDATDRETIFVQNIDFRDVAIDDESEKISEKITSDAITDFDDTKNDEIIDRNDETDEIKNEITNSTNCWTNYFDFFACRLRICSWNLMLLSNLIECLQRLHVYFSIRFVVIRIFSFCFNDFFAFCLKLCLIFNSCFRTKYFFCIFFVWMNQLHFETLIKFEFVCSWYSDRKFCVFELSTNRQMQSKND